MSRTICIPERLSSAPGVAHPGLCAGLLAAGLDGAVEVRLLHPIPAQARLTVEPVSASSVILARGGRPLAAAARATLAVRLPKPPRFDAIRGAPCLAHAGVPACYGCGSERAPGSHLGLRPRRLDGLVASPLVPGDGIAAGGTMRSELAWAALTCTAAAALPAESPRTLERIAAQIFAPLAAGRRYIVAAWPNAANHATAAIWDDQGIAHAIAITAWQ